MLVGELCRLQTLSFEESKIFGKGLNPYQLQVLLKILKENKESICKTGYVPLMMLCHRKPVYQSMLRVTVTLTFIPLTPKINREHLLSMNFVYIKSEKAGPNQTVGINWTRKYNRRADGQTGAKQYTPFSSKGWG